MYSPLFLYTFHVASEWQKASLNLTQAEDGGEEGIADLEGESDCSTLVVVLDPHRDHVQEYEDKDGNLKASGE